MKKPFDYVVVGAGLTGLMFTYFANQKGKRCYIIEKSDSIGGLLKNTVDHRISVHNYGAHIFHTSNRTVWNFVNSIAKFKPFVNQPVANYKGKLYNMPINMNTLYQLWGVQTPAEAENILKSQIDVERKQLAEKLNVDESQIGEVVRPNNLEDFALINVGKDVYETLIKGYTEKQWGRPCNELPTSIIKRIPIRLTFNNNYFNDLYQGIPENGYNAFIFELLYNSYYLNDVELNCDFNKSKWKDDWFESLANRMIYTGPIDAYFNYKFGHLDYRSVRFEEKFYKDCSNKQGVAVMNYTDKDVPYTRTIEHKLFSDYTNLEINEKPWTIVSTEYPMEYNYEDKDSIPAYPINDTKNEALIQKYRKLAEQEKNVAFIGRLAEYKYYDMDDIVEQFIKVQMEEINNYLK